MIVLQKLVCKCSYIKTHLLLFQLIDQQRFVADILRLSRVITTVDENHFLK